MKPSIYLGVLDEIVTDEHKAVVTYTTNKVGGNPNWIENKEIPMPVCGLCGLVLPMVVQVYGPLENSQYHRTLYLFGCINPDCWNKRESWVCLRSQVLDCTISNTVSEHCKDTVNDFNWCDGASVWGDEENKINNNDQTLFNEDDLSNRISLLNCNKMPSMEAKGECLPTATAEIEEDEGEMVTIDTPLTAQTDLAALMLQESPMPQVLPDLLEFTSFFISVVEEDHNKAFSLPSTAIPEALNGVGEASVNNSEQYEKTVPAHGDKMFHRFISTIQKTPGQILRYIRDGGSPLFLYPADDVPQQCQHCTGELVFELQLLPTLVSSLQLVGSVTGHIEYGTVFVLSCKNSCWADADTCRSEYVYVQRELM